MLQIGFKFASNMLQACVKRASSLPQVCLNHARRVIQKNCAKMTLQPKDNLIVK
jgi:hypothetical protein